MSISMHISPSPCRTDSRAAKGDEPKSRDASTCSLLREAQHLSGRRRTRVRDEAIAENLPLADALAARYRDRGEPLDDLTQVARLGLVKAVDRFDPDRGDFTVYAIPTITGELKRHFRDHAWMVRPPRRIQELQGDLGKATSELAQRLGRTPREADVAGYLGRDPAEIRDAKAARGCFRADSLDVPAGEGASLLERIFCSDGRLEHAELSAWLEPVLARLSDEDRWLLRQRFVEERAQSEIARMLGTNQMAVSRRLRKLLDRLRSMLSETGPRPPGEPVAA